MNIFWWLAWIYVVFWAAFFALIVRMVWQELGGLRVPALVYHRIIEDQRASEDGEQVYVNLQSDFEKQMDFLENYQVLSMDDYASARKGEMELPPKPVLITFDDGFESNYTLAYPLLKKHNYPAVIFVTTCQDAENFRAYQHLDSRLTPAQMKEMSQNRIAIQSHGHWHRHLTSLSSIELAEDLRLSKALIEEITEQPVRYLAAPFGLCNHLVKEELKAQGYSLCFAGNRGANTLSTPAYDLRRIVVERDFDLDDFASALTKWGVIRDKIIGLFRKDLAFFFLGEKKTERLREIVYGSFLAQLMKPAILRLVVVAVGGMATLLFGLSLWWIVKNL